MAEPTNHLKIAELARGGELFDLLVEDGPPDEAHTAALMKSLSEAVAFVHFHGIIHGDIKVGEGRGGVGRGSHLIVAFQRGVRLLAAHPLVGHGFVTSSAQEFRVWF